MTLQPQQLLLGARIIGRFRHARLRGAPPAPLHRRPDRHRQSTLAAQSDRPGPRRRRGPGVARPARRSRRSRARCTFPRSAPTISSTSIRPTPSGRSASIPYRRVPEDLKPIVADGVVAAFRHVWPDSWGPRLDYMLTNAVRALLDVPGGTLLMLPRLLDRRSVSRAARRAPRPRSGGAIVLAQRVCRLRRPASAPKPSPRSRTRSASVLMEPRLRNMLAQPKSTITCAG